MSNRDDKSVDASAAGQEDRPESSGRRALLRSGVTAMPAILTLQSGAALARSSNLISAAPPGTTDSHGRTLCLDTNSVYPAGSEGDVYDLGDPPRAEVNIITNRRYRTARGRRGTRVSKRAVCEGGTFWYNDRDGTGWHKVTLPRRGIVVSSGAMTSIADHVIETLI